MSNFTTVRIPQTSSDERTTILAASRLFGSQHPGRWAIRGYVVASFVDEDGNRWADVKLQWVGDR